MPKLSRGSFVILLMCTVALGLSIYASWFRYQAGDGALRFWGRDSALRIRNAETVTLLVVGNDAPSDSDPAKTKSAAVDERIEIEGIPHQISRAIEITGARGLIHARHALLEDASLDEAAAPPSPPHHWHRLIRFTSKDRGVTTVAIDLDTGWLCNVDKGELIKLKEPDRSLVLYVKKLAPRQKDIDEAKAKAELEAKAAKKTK